MARVQRPILDVQHLTTQFHVRSGWFPAIVDVSFKLLTNETLALERIRPIGGVVPGIDQMSAGCRFFSRCDFRQKGCAERMPQLTAVDGQGRHLIRCRLGSNRNQGSWGESEGAA